MTRRAHSSPQCVWLAVCPSSPLEPRRLAKRSPSIEHYEQVRGAAQRSERSLRGSLRAMQLLSLQTHTPRRTAGTLAATGSALKEMKRERPSHSRSVRSNARFRIFSRTTRLAAFLVYSSYIVSFGWWRIFSPRMTHHLNTNFRNFSLAKVRGRLFREPNRGLFEFSK